MANRLSKITTRTGDDGSTGLGNGERLQKSHIRIEVMGDIDELNSAIGIVLTEQISSDIRDLLIQIQHDLFDLGGEMAISDRYAIMEKTLSFLDERVLFYTDKLPYLKEFILPGGNRAGACLHVARTICRRAERHMVALSNEEKINSLSQKYLNRLSDLLFQISRIVNEEAGISTIYWKKANS